MKFDCTLTELNALMAATFSESALKVARLSVEVYFSSPRHLVKTYPAGIVDDLHRMAYDVAYDIMASTSGSKITAIKAVREVLRCDLRVGKDLIEKWYPQTISVSHAD